MYDAARNAIDVTRGPSDEFTPRYVDRYLTDPDPDPGVGKGGWSHAIVATGRDTS